jgi:hypothetical protein
MRRCESKPDLYELLKHDDSAEPIKVGWQYFLIEPLAAAALT